MPRYPYNDLGNHFWPEAPPNWPWRTEDDRDLVWNRGLPEKLLRIVQEIAVLYGKWIKPLTDCGPEAQLLVAASLSLRRLQGLLDGVTSAVLQASQRHKARKGAIAHWRTKQTSREEAFTGLLCVLEGIQCISAVIAGKEEFGSLTQTAASSADPYLRLGFIASDWSPNALLAYGLVARALENDWDRIRATLQSIPNERVLHGRLETGLKLAAKEFLATSKTVFGKSPTTALEEDAYRQAVAAFSNVPSERFSPTWQRWCAATAHVRATGQVWRQSRWVDAHGNQSNQSLRVQLLKEESRVCQYALLMRGNGQRHRAMIMLVALHLLLATGKRYATTLLGAKWTGVPTRRLQSLFDVDIVEPDVREQWDIAMADRLKKCAQLIRIATQDGQEEPWMLQKHYRQFVKKGVVGGKGEAYRKRRIVEELLAPMQAIGLAAQLPWDRVLQADSSRRKTGASQTRVTLDTCHGKAWVVNPLAIVQRPQKRGGGR